MLFEVVGINCSDLVLDLLNSSGISNSLAWDNFACPGYSVIEIPTVELIRLLWKSACVSVFSDAVVDTTKGHTVRATDRAATTKVDENFMLIDCERSRYLEYLKNRIEFLIWESRHDQLTQEQDVYFISPTLSHCHLIFRPHRQKFLDVSWFIR